MTLRLMATWLGVERLSLACGWAGPPPGGWAASIPPARRDSSGNPSCRWKLAPEVRAALPSEWMRCAWDRWRQTQATAG